jgi:phosphocarrier protein
MKQFNFTITDPLGIHARPAGLLAKEAKSFGDTIITITKDDSTVKASQLMKLMGLGIKQGDTVTIAAEGPAEDAAIAAMEKFLKENL